MLVYLTMTMTVMIGVGILAVDMGRQQIAQGELQAATDAAARYAAVGMISSSTRLKTARDQATLVAAEERVDGQPVTVAANDIELGYWNASSSTFVPVSNESNANAVRVTFRQTLGANGSMPLFAQALGASPRPLRASTVAMATVTSTEVVAPASGNLWLSDAPNNTTITNNQSNTARYDNSGTSSNRKQRPREISLEDLGLKPGDIVSFEGLSGTGNNGSGASDTGPDGNMSHMVSLGQTYSPGVPAVGANGIANTRAPLAACMGLFLSDSLPTSSAQPSGLDFGTEAQRDYLTLAPLCKQPFFVGDGKTSAGEVQQIRIPAGATRIFLGMMDAWQWNDNVGSFTLKFYRGTTVSTVR